MIILFNHWLQFESFFFFIDAFNDEIDKVRLNAIYTLQYLCQLRQVILLKEQMDIVVSVLFDTNDLVRNAVKHVIWYVFL
jgi:hypothetical protein